MTSAAGAVALSLPLGTSCTLTLASGRQVSGRVFSVDAAARVVVLERAPLLPGAGAAGGGAAGAQVQPQPLPAERDSVVVNTASVVGVVVTAAAASASATGTATTEELPPLSTDVALAREKWTSRTFEEKLLSMPAGVPLTPFGRAVYEYLSKTYQIKWKNDVMEEVRLNVNIKPPYRPEDVSGKDSKAVERIRDMLVKLTEKFAYLQPGAPAPVAAPAAAVPAR